MRRKDIRKRWIAGLLGLTLAFGMVPAVALAEPDPAPVETGEGQAVGDVTEPGSGDLSADAGDEGESEPTAQSAVYVSSEGNDETGNGTEDNPYASLAKAVEMAKTGDTICLLTNVDASRLALVDEKDITINGNGNVVTRAEDFAEKNDQGRGGYNPAIIEVANGSTLTLTNITLDDNFQAEADQFDLASGTSGNNQKVQDGIIASYGDGHSTIILDEGTTLKNFGGLSAVYITGEGGEGATLIMKSGSKICDDKLGFRRGGYAAIFNHGGAVEAEAGSSIECIDGRAVYIDNAGVTTFSGTVKNLTSNDYMKHSTDIGPSGGSSHFGGIVAYVEGSRAVFALGETCSITDIKSHNNDQVDTLFYLNSGQLETKNGSLIYNIKISLLDSNGGTTILGGTISNCNSGNVPFRLRGGNVVTFKLLETGLIDNTSTTDAALIYEGGGRSNIEIAGTIDGSKSNKPALFLSSNDNVAGGTVTVTETGKITNVKNSAILCNRSDSVTIAGTITNCSSYAVKYEPKAAKSLLTIAGTANIENNNNGKAQIQVTGSLTAADAQEHLVIEPGGLDGNKTVDLKAFDVTLGADYESIKLGNANSAAADAIKKGVAAKYGDWVVASSSAAWIQPTSSEVHFTVPHSSSMKKTGLFAALIPLNADGTPVSEAEVILQEVENTDPVDVTLTGLTADQSYAMMFVNNNEYTLAPDDITIYTGGGQGQETSDNGFPALTLTNCLDDVKKLEVDGDEITSDDLMGELLKLFTVSYTDLNGKPVTNDSEPGEYVIKLECANGQEHTIRINGNDVNPELGTGTLIVRHTENTDEAINGTNTYPLATEEPTKLVTNATAIAKESSLPILLPTKFFTNDDEDREVDAAGIQLLDDDLLSDEDGTDRQALLEQKAVDSGILPALGEAQAYRYDFHYLDLVDAYNGNAWVSASYGTTVYLPYPDGMTYDEAKDITFTVVHYPELHREYGISGQAKVEEAIAACTPEMMTSENTTAGIKFDVPREGFSPFAIVWQTEAATITPTAGDGGTITPSDPVTVPVGDNPSFTMKPNDGYAIDTVTVDGNQVNVTVNADGSATYTFQNVTAGSHTINVTFRSTGSPVNPPVTQKVTLTYVENGGRELDDVTVAKGTEVELATPLREGYTFEGWFFDSNLTDPAGMGGAKVKLTKDTTVYAKWSRSGVPGALTRDHVNYILGRIAPDGTRYIAPLSEVTRAEVATMVYRLLDDDVREEYRTSTCQFPDVSPDAWYAEPVATLAAMDAVYGYPQDGCFHPDDPITRAELVAIITRLDERFVEGENYGELPFNDVPEDHWAWSVLSFAANRGWLMGDMLSNGRSAGTFRPDDSISRAETMAIFNRLLQRLPETEDDLLAGRVSWPDNQDKDAWYYLTVEEATNNHDHAMKSDGVHERWTKLLENVAW